MKLQPQIIKHLFNGLNLQEIKNELLGNYTSDFELIGDYIIGERKQLTAMRFEKRENYESYISIIDMDYDADDTINIGCNYKLIITEFNEVIRSEYGKVFIYTQNIVEVFGNNCYIPPKCFWSVKSIIYLTGKDCDQMFLDCNRDGKRQKKPYD